MKNKKWYWIFLYTIVCIMLDIIGRVIADKFSLPLWFDSVGTVIMAYIGGPVCGAIVGLANNLAFGIFVDMQAIFFFVGAAIGIVAGLAAKQKMFETPFQVMSLGMALAIMCTVVSVPIDILSTNGTIGNVWGDQLAKMCIDAGVVPLVSTIIGQFYIEFLDKTVCVTIVAIIIRISRKIRNRKQVEKNAGRSIKTDLLVAFLISLVLGVIPVTQAKAATTKSENYSEYIQTVYGNAEGLLAGGANDIEQTKDGRIWIGTYAGLYSYDGTKFRLYKDIESVKNVNTIFVDEEGRLWVGTNDNGFTIMNNGHVLNVMNEDDGLPSNTVRSITCDSEGYYYIGTAAGLSIVTLSGGVKIQKSFDNLKNITCLTADKSGNVVALTDDGNVYWIKDGEIINGMIDNLHDYSISAAYFADNGILYLGTYDKQIALYQMYDNLPRESKVVRCTALKHINAFKENELGEVFICSDTGVGYFDARGKYKEINTNDFTSSISGMIQDYQGDLWFASERLGVLRMCKSSFAELFEEMGVNNCVTNTITKWNGLIYCGTDEGLVVLDEVNGKTVENDLKKEMSDVRIRCIMVDSKNNLWISTSGYGIYRASIGEFGAIDIKHISDEDGLPGKRFRCITELENGIIAVSGDEGVALIKYDTVMKTYTGENGLINPKSLCLMENDGILYVGSDGAGITMIKDGEVCGTITRADGLSSNVVMKLVYDEESEGIFVVSGNGLNYIAKTGEVTILDNFPYYDIFDVILGDDGSAWVLSSAGIYIGTIEQLITNASNNEYDLINSKRGLRAELTANAWDYMDNGILYMASDKGAIRVDTGVYDISAKSYRMILNSINVDGVDYEISRTSPAKLPSGSVKIVIDPEILNYSLNDPYISYRLVGFDAEDKIVLLSELDAIVYSNLKAGDYTFKISVLDNRKESFIETGRYDISIQHEMYEHWWFKVYVAIVTILIVVWITWFITRIRIQRVLIKQELELEYTKKQLKMGRETILSIARAVDAKDSNTSEHSFRVSVYSVAIARHIGWDEEHVENLRQMALLHDIGKIGIPDAILNKPAKLSDEEYEVMKTHVVRGGEILKDFSLIENVNVGALYHHERYDGKGYSSGLKGEEIPIEARIIGIADAFDAMTANRVYRKKLELDFVLEELRRCSGSQFDPKLAQVMIELVEEGKIDIEELYGISKEEK